MKIKYGNLYFTFDYSGMGKNNVIFMLILIIDIITIAAMKNVAVRCPLAIISPNAGRGRASDFLRKQGNRHAISCCPPTELYPEIPKNRASAF